MLKTILLIAAGGAIGSVFRYGTYVLVNRHFPTIFPLATFLVNIVGCFLIGLFLGLLEKHQIGGGLKWFLITGFCGGFTTFSAFGLENYSLFNSQNPMMALAYIGASVLAGLFAVWIGLTVSQ